MTDLTNTQNQHDNNNADRVGLITPPDTAGPLNQPSAIPDSTEPLNKVNNMDNNNNGTDTPVISLESVRSQADQKTNSDESEKTTLTDDMRSAWVEIYTDAIDPPEFLQDITNKKQLEQLLKRTAKVQRKRQAEELKAERQKLANPENLRPPFSFLGYDEGVHFFISNSALQIMGINGEKLTGQAHLMQLAELDWWMVSFPKLNDLNEIVGVDWLRAGDWVLSNSHAKGVYDAKTLRGRGFWYDSGKLVRHLGDRLLVDGNEEPVNSNDLANIYQLEGKVQYEYLPPATKEQTEQVYNLINNMYWADEYSPALLIGWIITGPFAGILPWRPHIWITGPSGSGKSDTVLQATHALLGSQLLHAKGGVTEASVRQKLKLDARPALIDELEPNTAADKNRIDKILGLARVASSDDDATVMKGSASGRVQEFRVRSQFAYASIKTRLIEDADKNRTAVLTLLKKEVSEDTRRNFAEIKEAIALLKKDGIEHSLIELTLNRWDLFQQNLITCEKAINLLSSSGREGKQYGTLLAGYYTMILDKPVTEEQVTNFANNKGLAEMIAGELENSGDEWGELWRQISATDLPLSQASSKITVGEAIEAIQLKDNEQLAEWGGWQALANTDPAAIEPHADTGKKRIYKALQSLGIVPRLKNGYKIPPALAEFEGLEGVWIAVNSPKLKAILSRTSFEDWQSHIKRAGFAPKKQIKVNGKAERGYFIPFE
ncbi:hypothetical protein N473_12885 [Pseudoalteromonas luteoviolacea CPMOR-1]|uniref:Uncharacterized protein n=1 Tax=Pseudoalteromonas luteoviolacea CPMOR-1 TaxID=1365248 RepID=A0A162CAS1_9GAMM|nr:hypothetical protein [Pseudoalteromonas luteoviolacea]KZN64927.1 hypothetical protein N473_12885 [Pseudoalteromonas luteoviolacea CPMOR-1]